MPFWDRPDARTNAPLHEVVVRAEHLEGGEPRYVTLDVQEFVISMIQTAGYPRSEVPRDAVISAAVDFYFCTIENGGHDSFIGNSCWDDRLRADIKEGLERLGLDGPAAIFADLEEFARTDPERFETSDWSDPTITALDERFHALPLQACFERHAAWIRSWPNLQVVPSTQYYEVLKAIADRNRKLRRWWWQ